MPVSWFSVGKLVIGNLDTIIGVSKPFFTRRKIESLSHQAELVTQQIAELQAASAEQAEQIGAIAADLKTLVTALEQGAVETAAERARMRVWAFLTIVASIVAVLLAMAALFGRR
jgi:predicted RecB family endonuclease